MKAIADPTNALSTGLAAIRTQYKVPGDFPPQVLAAAEEAALRAPTEHVDRTAMRFVTLDPATSTDLDQAFTIEASGSDLLLHYAIADVAWFVDDGGVIDVEAWARGETIYLPDGKAGLYPPVLAEGAASLLPDGDRPAVIFTTRVSPDGSVKLDAVERAVIRSVAKLAYDGVAAEDLPPDFAELSRRIEAAATARGAARVDPPQQEVAALSGGGFSLEFRPRVESEDRNAALSLASNLAVADLLFAHQTGLFRVMPEADKQAIRRLHHSAKALEIDWPKDEPLKSLEARLDPNTRRDAAMMAAIRRSAGGAAYEAYAEGVRPWHSAMEATYVHSTAPLRRLADRYVVMAALAVANGKPVPPRVSEAFTQLPKVMAKADALAAQVERATIDLAEAVMLESRIGEKFEAVVTDLDERGARIQICGEPIVARVAAPGVQPGDLIPLSLTEADPVVRQIRFATA